MKWRLLLGPFDPLPLVRHDRVLARSGLPLAELVALAAPPLLALHDTG